MPNGMADQRGIRRKIAFAGLEDADLETAAMDPVRGFTRNCGPVSSDGTRLLAQLSIHDGFHEKTDCLCQQCDKHFVGQVDVSANAGGKLVSVAAFQGFQHGAVFAIGDRIVARVVEKVEVGTDLKP